MTDNFYKSEIDRELLLNIEIQKQNLKALPAKFKAQKKAVSPVTQQMIDDYKKQFRDLYKRKNAKGTEQFFKFLIPDALPTLEKKDYTTLKPYFDSGEVEDINIKLDELILDYKDQEQGLRDQYRIIEESKNKINKLKSKGTLLYNNNILIEEEIDLFEIRGSTSVYENIDKVYNKYEKNNEELNKLEIQIKEQIERKKISEDVIPKIIITLENITTKINELKKQLEENDENILSNEKYLYTIEQNNRKKLAEYAETLKIMNEGQIDVTRGQDESEDDYLKRLGDVALIQEDLTVIHLFNNNEFKKNLKTIVSSEWKIENISKAFTNDDKFLLNKTIEGFKKYFKDKTGLGNKNLDVDEYISLIRDYMDSEGVQIFKKITDDKEDGKKEFKSAFDYPEQDGLIKPKEEPQESSFEETKEEPQGSSSEETKEKPKGLSSEKILTGKINDKEIVIINTLLESMIYFKLNPDKNDIAISTNGEDYGSIESSTPYQVSFQAKLREILNLTIGNISSKYIIDEAKAFNGRDEGGITKKEFITYIEEISRNPNSDQNKISEALTKINKIRIENEKSRNEKMDKKYSMYSVDRKTGEGLRKSKKSKRKKIIAQKGASVKQVDKFSEFGNLILLLRKLYDTNVLSIKDKNGINIPGIPNQKVNDNFVNLILKIVNNEDVNLKDIDDLNQKDSILFTVLMNKAGLKKKYQINNVRTLEALSKRLELLEGEFEAGNDNDLMIKELYEIVFKLAYLGAITLSNAKKHYKQTVKLLKKN